MKKIIHKSPTQIVYEDGNIKRFKRGENICICGKQMTWHETSSTAGANLGYWECECGAGKDGYQMWGCEPIKIFKATSNGNIKIKKTLCQKLILKLKKIIKI